MPRRKNTKKTAIKNIPSKTKRSTIQHKDLRFSISLVILIGLLTFSLLLLLVSLNNTVSVSAAKKTFSVPLTINDAGIKKAASQVLDDTSLDFKVTVPARIGGWLYKIGEVQSLVDDSLSNQYLRIYIPAVSKKSNNFDQQNKYILTIRRFSSDEWAAIERNCKRGKKEICDAAGQLVVNQPSPEDSEWVYAYTKPVDCPADIEAKCSMADKIIESFQLK